jgi:hypothetical protein
MEFAIVDSFFFIVELLEAAGIPKEDSQRVLSNLASAIREAAGIEKDGVLKTEVESLVGAGGNSCAMRRVKVVGGNGTPLILKSSTPNGLQRSVTFNLTRESNFYEHKSSFGASSYATYIPSVYFSYSDDKSGVSIILMEDLSVKGYVQSGYFWGGHSPLNWGKDTTSLTANVGIDVAAAPKRLAMEAARFAGGIHGVNWCDKSLLECDFLKNALFYKGQGQQSWVGTQAFLGGKWEAEKQRVSTGESLVVWVPELVALIDASVAKAADQSGWESFQKTLGSFTLIHGDFHPANMMARRRGEAVAPGARSDSEVGVVEVVLETKVLDFEMIGVGLGAQDMAQYMISHAEPALRRAIELDVLHEYYRCLVAALGESGKENVYSFEECLADYKQSGLAKWIFLLIVMAEMMPAKMEQYFVDQVLDFAQTHGITPETVPAPQV